METDNYLCNVKIHNTMQRYNACDSGGSSGVFFFFLFM